MSLWSPDSTRYFEYPHCRKRDEWHCPKWLWLISGNIAFVPIASWVSSWGSAEHKFSGELWSPVHKISRTFPRNHKQKQATILSVLIPLGTSTCDSTLTLIGHILNVECVQRVIRMAIHLSIIQCEEQVRAQQESFARQAGELENRRAVLLRKPWWVKERVNMCPVAARTLS